MRTPKQPPHRRFALIAAPHKKWSLWVAAFWGATGAVIVILSALLYQSFNWWVGVLLVTASASFAVARVLKQPGTES
jgi:hypothetical protein